LTGSCLQIDPLSQSFSIASLTAGSPAAKAAHATHIHFAGNQTVLIFSSKSLTRRITAILTILAEIGLGIVTLLQRF
jgi:hypothetical protein